MTNGASLERLVGLAGIETEYWDIWGNHHPVGRRARAASSPHWACRRSDEARSPAASIDRLATAAWRRWLPSVLVVCENEPVEMPLSLPAERAACAGDACGSSRRADSRARFDSDQEAPVRDRRGVDGSEVLLYGVPLPSPCHVATTTVLRRRPAEEPTAADRCAAPLLAAAGTRVGRANLGHLGPALLAVPAGQLGDRRLHRSARAGRCRRRSRRHGRRPQSLARAVPDPAGGGEPVFAVQPAVSQSALHRRRSDRGVRILCRGAGRSCASRS